MKHTASARILVALALAAVLLIPACFTALAASPDSAPESAIGTASETVAATATESAAPADSGDKEQKAEPTLWESIRQNAAYVASFAAIIAAVFALAALFEHIARKKTGEQPIPPARRSAVIGVFSALAFVLFLLEFPLPFLAPPFYKLDFSEIPVLIGAYAFGPVAGVLIEFVKIVLKLAVKGTSTAFVGELANFVVGCSFVLPASIIYEFNKTKKGAFISGGVGTLSIAAFGSLFNAVYLLPAFSALFHMPIDVIIGMGHEIIPAISDVPTFAFFAVAPFNLIKGASVTLVTLLVYKKLSPILKYGRKKLRAGNE